MKKNTLIISPSGNFYGSEQVLQDFLTHTTARYSIFIPSRSILSEKINKSSHEIIYFSQSNIPYLYFKVFLHLLLGKYSTVYLNEGGHINWIILLSYMFKNKKFVVHLRIVEDLAPSRLLRLGSNIKIITISKYMSNIHNNISIDFVYDPYHFSRAGQIIQKRIEVQKLKIGIIGRVSLGKGVRELLSILMYINKNNNYDSFEFHFFGDIVENKEVVYLTDEIKNYNNVFFHGFVENKEKVYESIDVVLHLSKHEPLGRIFFEALDYCKPLIGPNDGGIGELGRLLGLEQLLFSYEAESWEDDVVDLLNKVRASYTEYLDQIEKAKMKAVTIFDARRYVEEVENLF